MNTDSKPETRNSKLLSSHPSRGAKEAAEKRPLNFPVVVVAGARVHGAPARSDTRNCAGVTEYRSHGVFCDADRRRFLDALDRADFEVSDREAELIEVTMQVEHWTPLMRAAIDALLVKYGERVGI